MGKRTLEKQAGILVGFWYMCVNKRYITSITEWHCVLPQRLPDIPLAHTCAKASFLSSAPSVYANT